MLNLLVVRLVCTNGLLLDRALRQVHLGKRIDDGADFSVATHELDTRTIASAVDDIVRAQLARVGSTSCKAWCRRREQRP